MEGIKMEQSKLDQISSIGGIVKHLEGEGCTVAFGSLDLLEETFDVISGVAGIDALLFYSCSFKKVQIVGSKYVKSISIMHGNFGDEELGGMGGVPNLSKLKLFDTKVTEIALEKYRNKYQHVAVL